MDFPTHIDTLSMGLSIVHFKETQVEFSKLWCISVPEDCFNLNKKCKPWWNDEMQHYAAFHQGLHCLSKNPFRGFQYTKG